MKKGTRRSTTLFAATLVLAMFAISSHSAWALQPDAPFLVFQQKNQAKWVEDDKNVEQKLAALRQRFGKRPNIIYVLADDVGWGELGAYLGGKVRGTPSPTLDQMAKEGMKFLSFYAEPSCTPSRVAINTGRHPVRTGLNTVIWPGQTAGLSPEEVTIAEILSEAGYSTAMWGKWHLGELPEHAPENQGYDYAHYGLYNGAVYFWADVKDHYKKRDIVSGSHPFYDFPARPSVSKSRVTSSAKRARVDGRSSRSPAASRWRTSRKRPSTKLRPTSGTRRRPTSRSSFIGPRISIKTPPHRRNTATASSSTM